MIKTKMSKLLYQEGDLVIVDSPLYKGTGKIIVPFNDKTYGMKFYPTDPLQKKEVTIIEEKYLHSFEYSDNELLLQLLPSIENFN